MVFFAFMWVCCLKMKRDGGGGSGVWRSCDRSSELSLIADQGLLSNPISGRMITKDLSCSGRKNVKGHNISILFFFC